MVQKIRPTRRTRRTRQKKKNHRADLILACGIGVMLGLLLVSGVYLNALPMPEQDVNYNMTKNTPFRPTAAVSHAPIFIDGDDPANDWDDCDAVTGNGTVEDPYVIADLEIDAGGSGSGIHILDSTAHLTIVNCTISNAGSGSWDAGIWIEDSEHVLITQCNIHSNLEYGMLLWQSSGINVIGNLIANNDDCGINVASQETIITGNSITDNLGAGILINYESQNSEYFSNAICANLVGLLIYVLPDTDTLVENWISDNSNYDILWYDMGVEWSQFYPNNYYVPYDPDLDSDFDGLADGDELVHYTNPFKVDTDMDNFLDGYEVLYGTNPLDPLSYPGMPQQWFDLLNASIKDNTVLLETVYALATQNVAYLTALEGHLEGNVTEIRAILEELGFTIGDTDYDGLDDLDEIVYGTSLTCADTDCDNLNDAFEVKYGTDPLNDDSDGDSWYDGVEVAAGTDPLSAQEYPGSETSDPNTEDNPKIVSYPLSVFALLSGAGLVLILRFRRKI